MRCPYCRNDETKVVDKRDTGGVNRRRRECLKCEKRFTTYERVDLVDLFVVKKDGTREGFDREKLKRGVLKACEKRPVSSEDIEKTVNEIEGYLRKREKTEVNSKIIGEMVMKKLKNLDKVAYIRFASVYKEFADIDDFKEELKSLEKK